MGVSNWFLMLATMAPLFSCVYGPHAFCKLFSATQCGLHAMYTACRRALTPVHWDPKTPLIASLEHDSAAGITATRLWAAMRRFFTKVAEVIEEEAPATAEKLRRDSTHWMRHTHATHALARGAELTTVRDNLRHASVSTTSIYLHSDEVKRARQMDAAFALPQYRHDTAPPPKTYQSA